MTIEGANRTMDVSDLAIPFGWGLVGWLAALSVLAGAARAVPWRRFVAGESAPILPAAIFALCLLWGMRAHVGEAFAFHLLGTAALALTVGAPLALIGGAVVVGVMSAIREAPWQNAGLVWLTAVAVPVVVATSVLRLAEWKLPPNFFVYVFAGCFFGAALAFAAGGLAAALLTVAAGVRPAEVVFGEYVPFLLYLGFGEATLTGMCLTLAVVYRPQWVATFADARYLRGR